MKSCLALLLAHLYMLEAVGKLSRLPEPNQNFLTLLTKVEKEKEFHALVVYDTNSKPQKYCMSDADLKKVNHTQLLLQVKDLSLDEATTLEQQAISRELLIVCCIAEDYEPYLLQRILQHLGRMRSTRFIFYWTQAYAVNKHEKQLQLLFKDCQINFLLNVIAVFENFASSQSFYTYTQFPQFRISRVPLKAMCFPNRLSDLKGITLLTALQSSIPTSFRYSDENNQTQILGYVTRIVKAFGRKHNANFTYTTKNEFNIFELIANGSVDIAIAVVNAAAISKDLQTSYIFELNAMMLMFPYPKPLLAAQIFVIIFNTLFTLIVLILLLTFTCLLTIEQWQAHQRTPSNILSMLQVLLKLLLTTTLRGILGQTMHFQLQQRFLHKFIYILLLMLGIYISTTITAYLQAYLTHFPMEPRITTFQQLLDSSLKIALQFRVYNFMRKFYGNDFFGKYEQTLILKRIDLGQDWQDMQNISYARVTTENMWRIWKRKQERLSYPLFYIADELYITKSMATALPLPKHSIYLDAINTLLSQLQHTGLLLYWQRLSYEDMIVAGLLKRDVINTPQKQLHILELSDFYYIVWLYALGKGLAILAFGIEVMMGRIKRQNIP